MKMNKEKETIEELFKELGDLYLNQSHSSSGFHRVREILNELKEIFEC